MSQSCVFDGLHAGVRAEQTQICAARREESDRHDAWPRVDMHFERARVANTQTFDVDNLIAVVGDEGRALFRDAHHRHTAERGDAAADCGASHRHHFDRQRKSAQRVDEFARIRDTDEHVRYRRDDFLARQRTAAAFDHRAAFDLVRAVHINRQRIDFVQIEHLDAVRLQARGGGGKRTRHRAAIARLVGSQRVDEAVRGGAWPTPISEPSGTLSWT